MIGFIPAVSGVQIPSPLFITYEARWSSGQDAALSRLKQGFDSLTGQQKVYIVCF